MLGYRPAKLYWVDSFTYIDVALRMRPSGGYQPGGFQPSGYPALLWLLRPFHSVALVVGLQHLMGLAIGVMIYAVLRRRTALPSGYAVLAAVPGLFDARFLRLEHAVLSDTLFLFLVVSALTVLLWSPAPSPRAAAAAGSLLACAALTRTIAVPLILLAGAHLALGRFGPRPVLALATAGLLPLAAYACWFHSAHGRFSLASGDGVSLWARTMTFADCRRIEPPPDLASLCPTGVRQDAASEYVWAPDSAINRAPGGLAGNNDRARAFAVRAITAQPFDYLGDVAHDTALAFTWTPVPHPGRVRPAFGFARERSELPDQPAIAEARTRYAGDIRGQHSVDPYAGFLAAYQYPAYLRGPLLLAILVVGGVGGVGGVGALGRRRAASLPWAGAVTLLVAPVAVLDFDHRYLLPVIPIACLAAGLAAGDLREKRAARRREPPPHP